MNSPIPSASATQPRPLPGTLRQLVSDGFADLPLPGSGDTRQRWSVLAEVAAQDLSLAKLFEGHTDAIAILAELGAEPPPPGSTWGTWCAEPPNARLRLHTDADGRQRLSGTKAWCSGAAQVSHAVVSAWNDAGQPCLASVALDQAEVQVTDEGWLAVGMAASGSVDVLFDGACATAVGQPGDYTARPGFWHGGAGIAACWLGGALGIARMARRRIPSDADPLRLAHLGAIDTALQAPLALLRESAAWIDRHPREDAQALALRCRLAAEAACGVVMHHAGRALGAGPYCRDALFAQAMADLPVYLRQSHAERDEAALGRTPEIELSWIL